MKKIDISTKRFPDTFTMVDDDMFGELNRYKWHVRQSTSVLYVRRNSLDADGRHVWVNMHHQVLRSPDGTETDHRDGNGLNNQKSNLRVCTGSQNQCNQRTPKNNKSGYKGVSWNGNARKWQASIGINGKTLHMGYFFCLIKAARTYDSAAREHFGEFARLNFPEKTENSSNTSKD